MPPLAALNAFCEVARDGGVRAAARRLATSPSALTRQLKILEAWAGVSLYESRPGSGFRLTLEGAQLARQASAGFEEINAAARRVRERPSSPVVWISTSASFAARWLFPRLAAENGRPDGTPVSILVDQGRGSPPPADGEIRVNMGAAGMAGWPYETLMHDQVIAVAAPKMAERYAQASPTDLVGAPLLHDRDPFVRWADWLAQSAPGAEIAPPLLSYTSADLNLRAAEAGLGIALTRMRLAQGALDEGRLVRLCAPAATPLPDAYLVACSSEARMRPAVRRVLAWLQKEASTVRDVQHDA